MTASPEIPAAAASAAIGSTRRTFANLVHVVGGEAMLRVANFVAAIVIARIGGATVFGIYATALAYATVAAMLADNGLGIATVRRIGAAPHRVNEAFTHYAVAKTLLFAPMIVALAVIGSLAHLSPLEWTIGSLIVLRTILQQYSQMNVTVLKALDRMKVIGPIQALHSALLLSLLAACYFHWRSIYLVLASMVVAQSVELILEVAAVTRSGVRVVPVAVRDAGRLMLSSTSAGVTLSIGAAIMRMDVIILSSIAGAAVAGVFAAAQSVIVIVYLLGALLASVLFPEMARLAHDPDALRHYIRHWVIIVVAVGVPVTIVSIFVGPEAIRVLFGRSFSGSGTILAVMLAASPAIVLNALFLHRAFALHLVRTYLGIYALAAVFSAALEITLARNMGAAGVALAVITREYLVLACFCLLWQQPARLGATAIECVPAAAAQSSDSQSLIV